MNTDRSRYQTPLVTRYASAEMCQLFSEQRRIETWRSLWIALAETQYEMGLGVTAEQVAELKAQQFNIDFDAAAQYERSKRHVYEDSLLLSTLITIWEDDAWENHTLETYAYDPQGFDTHKLVQKWVDGAWKNEGTPVLNTSVVWSLKHIDLTAYSGQTVRIAFFHYSYDSGVSTGWYIDDLRIVAKTPEFSGDFETGWDDWSADRGVWQVGIPTAGPGGCYEGSQCAGTVLDGNYPNATDSRFISSTMMLQTVTGM